MERPYLTKTGQDLARFGVAAECFLGEYVDAVTTDFEDSGSRRYEQNAFDRVDFADSGTERLDDFGRQTDGPWGVVSSYAEGDLDLHVPA